MDQNLKTRFDAMHAASRAAPEVTWATRKDRLLRIRGVLDASRGALAAAIAQDFGRRPAAETDLAEMFPLKAMLGDHLRHAEGWMRPRRVPVGKWFFPAKARIEPRPLGVIGILAPWNYPLLLTLGPLLGAIAAGNRVLVKASEFAPAFAEALQSGIAQHFAPDEIAIITGGPDVAEQFSALPFDHLVFTGSTATGRKVMAAAAQNLTPVTLELGGKSPALIAPDARLDLAAARIMTGKMLNAGQTCIAPDYVLVERRSMEGFVQAARKWVTAHYPRIDASKDYTSIINAQHYDRLSGMLAEAVAAGAQAIPLSDGSARQADRYLPPVAIIGAGDETALMQDEVFGPLLPIITYDDLSQAVAFIKNRPRPLAFYPFGEDRKTLDMLCADITAGGICVNDTLLQAAVPQLPFGGVGASGMGAWHGRIGFDRMSHLQPVFRQSRLALNGLMAPPYGRRFKQLMRLMTR